MLFNRSARSLKARQKGGHIQTNHTHLGGLGYKRTPLDVAGRHSASRAFLAATTVNGYHISIPRETFPSSNLLVYWWLATYPIASSPQPPITLNSRQQGRHCHFPSHHCDKSGMLNVKTIADKHVKQLVRLQGHGSSCSSCPSSSSSFSTCPPAECQGCSHPNSSSIISPLYACPRRE
jgi:hypothetical protein